MENMGLAEELVREFLLFRGFRTTLQAYEAELATDLGRGFEVEKVMDLVFSSYIPDFDFGKLLGLLRHLKRCFSSPSDAGFLPALAKLEASVLKYYIVYAVKSGKKEKVVGFFEALGGELLQRAEEWTPWFAVPYLKNPALDPRFRVYFSKEWFDALLLSFRNFLSEAFNDNRIPALLKISIEANTVKHLQNDIKRLNLKLSELQALVERKDSELISLLSHKSASDSTMIHPSISAVETAEDTYKESIPYLEPFSKASVSNSTTESGDVLQPQDLPCSSNSSEQSTSVEPGHGTKFLTMLPLERDNNSKNISKFQGGLSSEDSWEERQEEFPEVKFTFQETFLGHTDIINRCRFSASGNNIASASSDRTVRIWTYDSSTPTSRNATIYCGAEVMSLDWECKSDRLLLIGTSGGGIKAWNVDAKRVICDLSTTSAFPSILDLKCSPVEPVFVSAAASGKDSINNIDDLGLASLTVWSMKTWKAVTVLPLGQDPPAVTSLCFNHNGKILAASAIDGMIHMFDMSAGLQITGWPAHDSAVHSIQFGPDETSIFSMGSDGMIFEWSLHNQGQILWSRDWSRFCSAENTKLCRHEMVLDCNGRRLLTTSTSVRSPIYQVQGHLSGLRTLPHTAGIRTVDWHPTLPIFLTGSGDHSKYCKFEFLFPPTLSKG